TQVLATGREVADAVALVLEAVPLGVDHRRPPAPLAIVRGWDVLCHVDVVQGWTPWARGGARERQHRARARRKERIWLLDPLHIGEGVAGCGGVERVGGRGGTSCADRRCLRGRGTRSEEHTSELQSPDHLV